MNLLVDKLKSAKGGKAQNYASDHERTVEELQFVDEMIHNLDMEISTYQQEYNSMESEGVRQQVVGKLLRKKSDENLTRSKKKRVIESLQSHQKHLISVKDKLDASICRLDEKLLKSQADFGWKDMTLLFGSIVTKGPENVSEESSFRIFTGTPIEVKDIKPGMHLYRKHAIYSHHGICVQGKRGIYIIHFNGDVRTGGAWAKAKLLRMVKQNIQQGFKSPVVVSPSSPSFANPQIAQQSTQYPPGQLLSPHPQHYLSPPPIQNNISSPHNQNSPSPQSYLSPPSNHYSAPQNYPLSPSPQNYPLPHSPNPNNGYSNSSSHVHIQQFQSYVQNQVQTHLPHHHHDNSLSQNNNPNIQQNNYQPQLNYQQQMDYQQISIQQGTINYQQQNYQQQNYQQQIYPLQQQQQQQQQDYQNFQPNYPQQQQPDYQNYQQQQQQQPNYQQQYNYTQQQPNYQQLQQQQQQQPDYPQNYQQQPTYQQQPNYQQQQQQQQQINYSSPHQAHSPVPPPNMQQPNLQNSTTKSPNLQHPIAPSGYVQSMFPDGNVSKQIISPDSNSSAVDPKTVFNSGESIGVMESSIEEFVEGDVVYVANYKYFASDDVIQARAKRVLHQGGYSVVARNCEHLATWCVTGVGKSLQVQEKIVQKMAKVAEVVEKATSNNPNAAPKENLTRVLSAVPLPILKIVLNFTSKQVDKFGKTAQFL